MAEIGTYLYDGYPLEQKHAWMHAGPGAAAAVIFGDGLRALANRFDLSQATIGFHLIERGLGTNWQGTAAHAASGAFDRAATALTTMASSGHAGGNTAHNYGDSFTAARNAIAEPVVLGDNSVLGRAADHLGTGLHDTFGSTFGVQSDYTTRLAAHRAADQAANDALHRHENTTRQALATFTTAAAPIPAGTHPSNPGADGLPGGQSSGEPAGYRPPLTVAAPGSDGAPPSVPSAGGGTAGTTAPAVTTSPTATSTVPGATGGAAHPPPAGGGWIPLDNTGRTPPPGPNRALPPIAGHDRTPPPRRDPTGLLARTDPAPPASRTGPQATGDQGITRGPARPPGTLGIPPIGAAGGLGGGERTHRNQTYIPDDGPFHVEFTDLSPPVIGLPEPKPPPEP